MKMPETNGNCNIQSLTCHFTYLDTRIFIQCENSEEKSVVPQPCSGPGHFNGQITSIVKLDISYCSLDDLPDCLKTLPLKVLDVSHNDITAVPNCILRGLSSIEELNLSSNRIAEFQEEPRCYCNLKVLNISNNLFKLLPMWIQHVNAINLKEFYYSRNTMGNTCDAHYKRAASYNLQKAVFSSSYVTNKNLDFIKSIRTLRYLDLSNDNSKCSNVISSLETLFEKAAWYDTLEVLNFSNMNMSFVPDSIVEIFNIKELYLSQNDLFYLPNGIGDLSKLEVLDLSHNHICCLSPSFEKLTELKVLKLQHNLLCKIQEVYKLRKLMVLDLYHNELDDFDNNFEVPFLDLEQNMFDTNILANYFERRNLYRHQNLIVDRLNGPIVEIKDGSDADCSDYSSLSEIEDGEIEYQEPESVFVETESWDDVKLKTNPDITSSDEEWDGYFQYPVPRRKPVIKCDPDCYKIFQDCVEDQ